MKYVLSYEFKNPSWLLLTEIILIILFFHLSYSKSLRAMQKSHFWINRFYDSLRNELKNDSINLVFSLVMMLPLLLSFLIDSQLVRYLIVITISIIFLLVFLNKMEKSNSYDARSVWYRVILYVLCGIYLSLTVILEDKYYGILLVGSYVLGRFGIILVHYLVSPFIKMYCRKKSLLIKNDLEEFQGDIIGVYGDDNLSLILGDLLSRRKIGTMVNYDIDLFTFIHDFYRSFNPLDDYILLNIAFNMDASFVHFNKLVSNQYKNIDWQSDKLYYPSLYNPKGEGKTYGFIDGSTYQLVSSNRGLKGTDFTIRTKTKNYSSKTNLFTDSSLIALVGALSIYIEYFKEIPESCYFNLPDHYLYQRRDSRNVLLSRGSKDDMTLFNHNVSVAIICGMFIPNEVASAKHVILFKDNYKQLTSKLLNMNLGPECIHQVNTQVGAYELAVELSKKEEVIVIVEKEAA